jgi:hypothetical protein
MLISQYIFYEEETGYGRSIDHAKLKAMASDGNHQTRSLTGV